MALMDHNGSQWITGKLESNLIRPHNVEGLLDASAHSASAPASADFDSLLLAESYQIQV